MSLKVWLPLTGDLRNNGLSTTTITNNGAVVNDNGKIGKCYSFATSSYLLGTQNFLTNSTSDWTFCCWMKLNATTQGQCLFSCRRLVNSSGITIFYYGSQWLIDDGGRWQFTPTNTIVANTWYHICVVRKQGVGVYLYVNGSLDSSTATTHAPTTVCTTHYAIGNSQTASTAASGNPLNGYLNDVRVYDHALSVKEIKEISKGLVFHYTLSDNSIQTMTNCFNYPTFNTSSSNGGWSHWGSTGNKGSYGQTTDKQYIYNKDQQYAHWVQNAEGATVYYIMYQSPAFSGGTRSLCCIVKEENSLPITEEIVDPSWNANSGTVPIHKWTSISPLGNGFYLCKCEGFEQDGSNDLVALCIYPPYRVYISECYLENNRSVCSDIFYQTDIVYDSSGYCNNGSVVGEISSSVNTARNNVCTYFGGSSYISAQSITENVKTVSLWMKSTKDKSTTQFLFGDAKSHISIGFGSAYVIAYCGSSNGEQSKLSSSYVDYEWNHFVVISTGEKSRDVYCNGVKLTTKNSNNYFYMDSTSIRIGGRVVGSYSPYYYDGYISDIRMYATQLSEEDILELYHTPISIAKTGEVYTQGEYIEQ